MTTTNKAAATTLRDFADWLDTPAGARLVEHPITQMIAAHAQALVAQDRPARERAEITSTAVDTVKAANEALKVMRSDATYDMRREGFIWDDVCEALGVKRARADQILKGVSGGKYQVQMYKGGKRPGRRKEINYTSHTGHAAKRKAVK